MPYRLYRWGIFISSRFPAAVCEQTSWAGINPGVMCWTAEALRASLLYIIYAASNTIAKMTLGRTMLLDLPLSVFSIFFGFIGFVIAKLPVGSLGGRGIIMLIVLFQAPVDVSGFAIVEVISSRAVNDVDVVHMWGGYRSTFPTAHSE